MAFTKRGTVGRAGFRMLEIHDVFFRFELPFWKQAKQDGAACFPKTFASLDKIKKESTRKMKREQLVAAIEAGYNELIKMSQYYFSAPVIFLVLLLGIEGPHFARALLRLLERSLVQEPNGELATVVERNWTLPNDKTQLEHDFTRLMELDTRAIIHWLRQHGLAKPNAFSEIQRLAQEESSNRKLLDFRVAYPAIFVTLHSTFGLMPSSSRIAEQLHGMLRHHLTPQRLTSADETITQRQAYMMDLEYLNRTKRREQVEDRLGKDRRPSGGFKHERSKAEQQLAGEQVFQSMDTYDENNLRRHLTSQQMEMVTVKRVSKEGVRLKDVARATELNELGKAKAAKRALKNRPDKTVDEIFAEGDGEDIENDLEWVGYEQQVLDARRKELATLAFWRAQSPGTLTRVYKDVFPDIQAPDKTTKDAICKAIGAYLKSEGGASRINLQAAIGLESKKDSGTHLRVEATTAFLRNSIATTADTHYLEYCD